MRKIFGSLSAFLVITSLAAQVNKIVSTKKDSFYISWQNKIILSAKLSSPCKIQEQEQTINGAVYYIITIRRDDLKIIDLTGHIEGSDESIACQAEAPDNSLK